jgi:hypothetical protein
LPTLQGPPPQLNQEPPHLYLRLRLNLHRQRPPHLLRSRKHNRSRTQKTLKGQGEERLAKRRRAACGRRQGCTLGLGALPKQLPASPRAKWKESAPALGVVDPSMGVFSKFVCRRTHSKQEEPRDVYGRNSSSSSSNSNNSSKGWHPPWLQQHGQGTVHFLSSSLGVACAACPWYRVVCTCGAAALPQARHTPHMHTPSCHRFPRYVKGALQHTL